MPTREEVLATEFCEEFIEKMKDAMYVSFFKYGLVSDNYGENKPGDTLENLKLNLSRFEKESNLDYLVNVANQAMIRYMCPKKGDYYEYKSDRSIRGLSVKELEELSHNSSERY